MIKQGELFDVHKLIHPDAADVSIQDRFEAFHTLNPWVYERLEAMTAEAVAAGWTQVGIGMFFEVMRWQYARSTNGDPFRLNNTYRSRYVRLLVDEHPEWAGLFEQRRLRSE